MATKFIGGSFAPPITCEKLARYTELANEASEEVKDVMLKLCHMVEVFQQTPCSCLDGKPHRTGVGVVVPLEEEEKARIFDVVPWPFECDAYKALFNTITATEIRNAAFHLLWYAIELSKHDREPMTTDCLPSN